MSSPRFRPDDPVEASPTDQQFLPLRTMHGDQVSAPVLKAEDWQPLQRGGDDDEDQGRNMATLAEWLKRREGAYSPKQIGVANDIDISRSALYAWAKDENAIVELMRLGVNVTREGSVRFEAGAAA